MRPFRFLASSKKTVKRFSQTLQRSQSKTQDSLLKKTFKRGVNTDPPFDYNTDTTNTMDTPHDIETHRADRNWSLYTHSEKELRQEREATTVLLSTVYALSRTLRAHGGAADIAESLDIALALHRRNPNK